MMSDDAIYSDGTLNYQRQAIEDVVVGDEAVAARPAALMYCIGNRYYPMHTVSQCKTCNSHLRVEIEGALLRGRGYAAILRSLPEGHNLTYENIRDHTRKGHMPIDATVRRAFLETRAESQGVDLENCGDTIVDAVGLLQEVVRSTYEGIADGTVKGSMSDGVRAAQTLVVLQQFEGSTLDVDIARQAVAIFMKEAQKWFPEKFEAFSQHIDSHPEIAVLRARRAAAIEAAAT